MSKIKCPTCGWPVSSNDPQEHGIGFSCGIGAAGIMVESVGPAYVYKVYSLAGEYLGTLDNIAVGPKLKRPNKRSKL